MNQCFVCFAGWLANDFSISVAKHCPCKRLASGALAFKLGFSKICIPVPREATQVAFRALRSPVEIERPKLPSVAVHESANRRSCSTSKFQLMHQVSFQSTQGYSFGAEHTYPQGSARTAVAFAQQIYSITAGSLRPAEERLEPDTSGAWKVAPKKGNR
jgi:hypothetical protein